VARDPGSEREPVAVFCDGEPEHLGAAPLVRLCPGRQPRTWPRGGNPFANAAVLNYVGTEPEIDSRVIGTTLTHLSSGRFISLAELLADNAAIETAYATDSGHRLHHLERLRAFLIEHHIPRYIQRHAETILDELFTNAIYNAPVDELGRHINADKPRNERVLSQAPVEIRFAVDERHVAIAVRDTYGSLKASRVLDCLNRCFNRKGAVVEEKQGGAGLGFFLVVQYASRLVVNLKEGQFTEVISLHRRLPRRRDFLTSALSLNLCLVDGDRATLSARRARRQPVNQPVRLQAPEVDVEATALDISAHGAFVCGPDHLKALGPGTPVVLVLTPTPSCRLTLRGTAVWVGKSNAHQLYGVGIRFNDPLPRELCEGLLKSAASE
jgi:anti-sigma regulatory factor (Ser/Thr protein kinase)